MKTYFEQLTETIRKTDQMDPVIQYIAKDCLQRSLDWLNSHEEYHACGENDSYIKKQLYFLNKHISKIEK